MQIVEIIPGLKSYPRVQSATKKSHGGGMDHYFLRAARAAQEKLRLQDNLYKRILKRDQAQNYIYKYITRVN